MQGTEAQEIQDYLQTLNQVSLSNDTYMFDMARDYLRKQHLLGLSARLEELAGSGQIEEAEALVENYGAATHYEKLSEWTKPLDDPRFVSRVFERDESDAILRLGGALGNMVGDMRRSWLVMLMGRMKSGKTFGLTNFALAGVMSRLNVAYFSLEMEDVHIAKRAYHGLLAAGEKEGDYVIPVFDCAKNANDSCQMPTRTNRITRPEFYSKGHPYKPCVACRGTQNFMTGTWFTEQHRPAMTRKAMFDTMQNLAMQYGANRLRLKSYPIGTANIQHFERDLHRLELSEKWIPDMIVADYADITSPEERGQEGRDKENATWKALKRLAVRRKALVISGTQSNRMGFDKDSLDETNTSEDIRKLAHIDIAMTINQTDTEKEAGVSRIGILNHRWRDFNKRLQAVVLQNLKLGQFHIDSEMKRVSTKKK
jgi:hypothetical protein